MMDLIRSKYYFPRLFWHCKRHLKACGSCPLFKGRTETAPPGTYAPPKRPFETVFCDILTLPTSALNSRYLLVMIDQFSRYCELTVIPDKSANTVATAIHNCVVARHGICSNLVCDNGPEFSNSVLTKLCQRLNINKPEILI